MKVCSEPGCPKLDCKTHNVRASYNSALYRRARAQIQQRYRGTPCPTCGKPMNPVTVDHITPGQPLSAVRPLCLSCNSAKRGR